MTPWSVMAQAGISAAAAASNMSPMRLAPSSIEYSLWACRWTKIKQTLLLEGITQLFFSTPRGAALQARSLTRRDASDAHGAGPLWRGHRGDNKAANLWIAPQRPRRLCQTEPEQAGRLRGRPRSVA